MRDVIVVGGGVAGASAALSLARMGRDVTLLEREPGARAKVCGEFLSSVALAELAALGLQARSLGAVPLRTFRLSARAAPVASAIPFASASLTRERLDPALREAAERAGATLRLGVGVKSVEREGSGFRVTAGDEVLRAQHVVLASGKHDIRAHRRDPGLHRGLVGLKYYVELERSASDALGDAAELILFPHGYCGVQPVEGREGRANVCLVVDAAALQSLGRPERVFDALCEAAPRARELLCGAQRCFGRPLAIAQLPYGFVRMSSDGPYYVGDQAAVIPSFCGEGIALALASARAASEAIGDEELAGAFQRAFGRTVAPRVRAAALLSRVLCRTPLQPVTAGVTRHAPWLAAAILAATRTPRSAGSPHCDTVPGRGALAR